MEIKKLVGKNVVFKDVSNIGTNFETGMKAKVVRVDLRHLLIQVSFDFSEFEDHNKQFMSSDYFDDNQKPCLRWVDTKFYPSDKIEVIYFDDRDDILNYISVLDNDKENLIRDISLKLDDMSITQLTEIKNRFC